LLSPSKDGDVCLALLSGVASNLSNEGAKALPFAVSPQLVDDQTTYKPALEQDGPSRLSE
jgi:hypothetical protein